MGVELSGQPGGRSERLAANGVELVGVKVANSHQLGVVCVLSHARVACSGDAAGALGQV
jgi:hypothetical protein